MLLLANNFKLEKKAFLFKQIEILETRAGAGIWRIVVYSIFYPPPCRRPFWRDFWCRELRPQRQFYEFSDFISSISSARFLVEPQVELQASSGDVS